MAGEKTKAKQITHVGIIVEDVDRAAREWCERYGLEAVGGLEVEVEGVRSVFLSPGYGREEGFCIELVEPYDKSDMDNVVARRLAESGEGVFHVAMRMDDPPAAGVRLRELGVKAFDAPPAEAGEGARTMVHPRSANGILIELY